MSRPTHDAPISWGLVGYGAGGRVFHRPLITAAPEFTLTAVVTSSPERAATARAEIPGVEVVAEVADMVALGVEGVTITTPNATHSEVAHEALNHGLHVVVDKPFALSAQAARDVVAHGEAAGRLVVPYQNRRLDSDFRTLQALLSNGALGAVHSFGSRIERMRPVKQSWHSAAPEQGGGVVFDLGPHLIDQALVLFGPVASVYADLQRVRPGVAAEDVATIRLTHTDGVRSELVASLASTAAGPRFLVNGDVGGFVSYGFDGQEAALKAGQTPATMAQRWGAEPESAWGTVITGDTQVAVPSLPGAWDTYYPAVAEAVRGEGPPPVTGAEAVVLAAVIDACRKSAADGQVMEFPLD